MKPTFSSLIPHPPFLPVRYTQLVKAIDAASQQLLGHAASVVNQSLVIRNWIVGAYIVEFEQHGEDRAKYGARLMRRLVTGSGRTRGWRRLAHQPAALP